MSRLRVVVDIVGATPEHWAEALETLAELSYESFEIRGVVHSHAWPLVAKPEKGGAIELHEQAQALARRGVKLVLCENTMRGATRQTRSYALRKHRFIGHW